jgi:Luciferase
MRSLTGEVIWRSAALGRSGSPIVPSAIHAATPLCRIVPVPDVSAFVDEVANELTTWPGVRIERRSDGAALVLYEQDELGVLYPDRGVAELPFLGPEHDELVEHGDAGPAETTPDSYGVGHDLRGPSDVTAVLELFDRRYRDVRGEPDPYSSEDPGFRSPG